MFSCMQELALPWPCFVTHLTLLRSSTACFLFDTRRSPAAAMAEERFRSLAIVRQDKPFIPEEGLEDDLGFFGRGAADQHARPFCAEVWDWKKNIWPIGVRLWPVYMYEKPLKLHHKFHPSLGFASSVLQNVRWYWQAGKPVFKTVFYFFVISVALLLSTGFLAQFTHDKMNCSRSTCTWLNVKNHPRIRENYQADQNYHISHLFSYGICDFCTFLLQSLQALHHLRIFCELLFCDFSFHATSKKQRSEFKNEFQMCITYFWSPVEGNGSILLAAWTTFPRGHLNQGWILSESTCGSMEFCKSQLVGQGNLIPFQQKGID